MEIDPLDALRTHPQPPPDLEGRVVTAVIASQGWRPPAPGRRGWLLVAAAAAVFFVIGVSVGRVSKEPVPTTSESSAARYMLLLAGEVAPAADGSSRSEEYGAWARSVSATGVFIRGAELSPVARLVGAPPMDALAEGLATVGGYFIIEAPSEEDAVRLAQTCPHVKHGGTIQIRRLL